MTQARVLDGGKVTIPIEIRKWLQLKDGDKVTFIKDGDEVRMVNAAILAIEEIQSQMAGEASRTDLDSDEKIVQFCKEIRQDVYRKHYAHND